ncbi:hypothetical protein AKJ16_DCAP16873 [Drosera capensis]
MPILNFHRIPIKLNFLSITFIILYSINTNSSSYLVVTDEQPSGNRIVIEQSNKGVGEQIKAHPFPTTRTTDPWLNEVVGVPLRTVSKLHVYHVNHGCTNG